MLDPLFQLFLTNSKEEATMGNKIALSEVVLSSNRQRRTFDPSTLAALASSILSKGLLHPITLRADGKTLIAGERRLRAARLLHAEGHAISHNGELLPLGEIPYSRLDELDELSIREA